MNKLQPQISQINTVNAEDIGEDVTNTEEEANEVFEKIKEINAETSTPETADKTAPHNTTSPKGKPSLSISDPTDGREKFEYNSHYPEKIRKEQNYECCYLCISLFITFILLYANWEGTIYLFFNFDPNYVIDIKRMAYFSLSGLLGGIIFSMKNFYRVIARGYWHQDRKFWRIMSPYIAMSISFVIGAMVDAGMINNNSSTASATIAIGFLTGYFADRAVGKMTEIASVIFGDNSQANGKA